MKSTSLLAALAFAAASLLSSCKQDPQSANGPNLPLNSPSTPAHPAIAYWGINVIHRTGYRALGVMDTNASHQTWLYTAGSTSEIIDYPNWSPTGGSIAFIDMTGTYANTLQAIDVSVNSNGVAVGSNRRTLYSVSTSDSMKLYTPGWCSVSTTGKIAFMRLHFDHSHYGLAELCLISQSGGTPTVLASITELKSNGQIAGGLQYPTWKPDDSKIAVVRQDTAFHCSTILVFNASTGAVTDSIPMQVDAFQLEWSRTGQNELVFCGSNGTSQYVYYTAPTTGSTPSTNSIVGYSSSWSPNNSSVFYWAGYSAGTVSKVVPFSTTTTLVSSSVPNNGQMFRWKR
ncbi:MAG TPA: hypothetical protein VFD13_07560 [Candidatus Kapabacteria bacterium]|nr:hypothetical protein [Candidatus Kapabacteria bacterium]